VCINSPYHSEQEKQEIQNAGENGIIQKGANFYSLYCNSNGIPQNQISIKNQSGSLHAQTG